MAASEIVAMSTNTISDNTTRQLGAVSTSNNVATASEAFVQAPIREAGVFDRLYVQISSNTATVTTLFGLRIDGVTQTQVISIGSAQTGAFEDTTHTDSATASQYFNFICTVPNTAAATSATVKATGIRFTPTDTSKTVTIAYNGGSGQNYTSASTTTYTGISGTIKSISAEADCKSRIPASFTSRNLYVYVESNSRTTDTTVRTRINGANGNQSITIGSTQTGRFEDTTNTDSLTSGQDYNYSITTGTGTQTLNIRSITTTLISTENKFLFLAGAPDGWTLASTANDTFTAMSSNTNQASGTESITQIAPAFAFTLSELHVTANANTTNQTQAFRTRVNTANGNLVATFTSGTTGLQSDTTHSDSVTAGTLLALVADMATTGSGNISWHQIVVMATVPSAAASRPIFNRSPRFYRRSA